jgi:hypothetical protein
MGKRSDFVRRKADAYDTIDPRAVRVLLPHLKRGRIRTFAEPCNGMSHLQRQLEGIGLRCIYANDILNGEEDDDALRMTPYDLEGVDAIITNPPWTRRLLHPLILHFSKLKPTWLLFDADWAFNKHSGPYLEQCSDIVAIGRLRWIEGTTMTGKDNAAWYRFDARHYNGTKFHGRST